MRCEEKNEEIILMMSIEEKCEYYKEELKKYKEKYSELNEEYLRLKEDNQKILENLKKEKKIRKDLEEKIKFINISSQSKTFIEKSNNNSLFEKFESDEEDVESDENEDMPIINVSKENNDFKKNDMNKIIINDINDENYIKNKNYINNDINDFLNIEINDDIDNNIKNDCEYKKLIIENENNEILNNKIDNNNNNIVEKINTNIDINNNKNLNLDEEKLLSKDLILYGKDSISLRKDIFENESKTSKIYSILKKWKLYVENLKKGVLYFNKSVSLFNKHLAKYNNNIFSEFPFILEQIYILQKCFSSINIYSSSLIMTIDSSCSIQINDIISNYINKLSNLRINLNNKISNFIQIQNKYLSIKKNKKESKTLNSKYYDEYKSFEIMKYDYCCLLNKMKLVIKLKIPEMISLLTHSYITFFTNVKDELAQSNQIVRKNLEIILNKVKIKNKIENNMEQNRKDILDKFFSNVDKSIKNKEGFLNVKAPEKGKFEKRYVKISNGKLIYHKIIKANTNEVADKINNKKFLNMIDKINTKESYEICNLLLSNVKKIEKEKTYPFCFEINNANLRKAYKFQAETEYEMEEWISSITNAINEQIIGFDEYKNKNNKEINNSNNNEQINNKKNNLLLLKDEQNEYKKILIENLINENICIDCGAKKPTWLNINWLSIICMECSSIHRGLGVQISKIRSLELDNIINEYIELLQLIKQNEINSILEEKLLENEKPKYNSSREEKECFIINKYSKKKYINNENQNKVETIINIFKSIEKNNLFNIFKLIKLNSIDINKLYTINNEEMGFIHYCVKYDNIYCLKLLYILGADINLLDYKGQKAINLADKNKQIYFIKYLMEKESEKTK